MLGPSIPQLGTYQPEGPCSCYAPSLTSKGPPTIEGCQCCYEYGPGYYGCGRPFVVRGAAVCAELVERRDWQQVAGAAPFESVDDATLGAIAAGWGEDARMEHASIASFARFTLELLAIGAPADLVEAAQEAGLDEIVHARACFGLASRYAGRPLGPDALAVFAMPARAGLVEAATAAVEEGCVGETIAALIASEQLAVVCDDAAKQALARIAADEVRHAELAYRFVAWACDVGGAPVRKAVADAFVLALDGEARRPLPDVDHSLEVDALHHHGRLTESEQDAIRRAALREVIGPCASIFIHAARLDAPWPETSRAGSTLLV